MTSGCGLLLLALSSHETKGIISLHFAFPRIPLEMRTLYSDSYCILPSFLFLYASDPPPCPSCHLLHESVRPLSARCVHAVCCRCVRCIRGVCVRRTIARIVQYNHEHTSISVYTSNCYFDIKYKIYIQHLYTLYMRYLCVCILLYFYRYIYHILPYRSLLKP